MVEGTLEDENQNTLGAPISIILKAPTNAGGSQKGKLTETSSLLKRGLYHGLPCLFWGGASPCSDTSAFS